jgi:hypothetical protein
MSRSEMSGPDLDDQHPQDQPDEPRSDPGPNPDRPRDRPRARGRRALAGAIAVALAAVIVAPIALSSGDLVAWASSPTGLGLDSAWPLVVFVALDAAAAVCVGFVVLSAWKGESAGVFGLLVWAFASGGALANYRHGQTTPARDDAVFFACMSLAGPVLLHATVHRLRRWARTSEGWIMPARARFGLRWLPGVAFRETLEAWRASVRAGISRPDEAVAQVRERQLLATLEPAEAIRYAVGALGLCGRAGGVDGGGGVGGFGGVDLHLVRVWLASRGLVVTTAALTATLQQPVADGADGAVITITRGADGADGAAATAAALAATDAPAALGAPATATPARVRAAATPDAAPNGASSTPRARSRHRAPSAGARAPRTFKPLSADEQARVQAGLAKGLSGAAIARQMGVNVQRVRAYVAAGNNARAATTSESEFGSRVESRNGSLNGAADGAAASGHIGTDGPSLTEEPSLQLSPQLGEDLQDREEVSA